MIRHGYVQIPGLLLTLMFLTAPITQGQPNQQALADDPSGWLESLNSSLHWEDPAEPARIMGPLYFVGTRGLSVFLITTDAGHILINTGMPGSGPMIEASIRKLGFDATDINLILTGHVHVDHVGGHAYLKKLSGARLAMFEEEKEIFESGGKSDFHYAGVPIFEFEPATVDIVLQDGDELSVGDIIIKALFTAGHTRGSTTFVTQLSDAGSSYTAVFPNGTSLNPGYRLVNDPSYPGIADDFQHTFDVLESLQPDLWFYAHNEAFNYEGKLERTKTEGVQAWVDPAGYRRWVGALHRRFDTLLAAETETAE